MKKTIILTVIFLLLTPKYALSSFSCYLDFDKCLQKADSGDVESQHKVAKYFMGVTGKKNINPTKAIIWLQKAAEQGYAPSQHVLAAAFYKGEIVTQDYIKAIQWLNKSSLQGYAISQYSLSIAYEDGHGVPQSNIEAHYWASIATNNSWRPRIKLKKNSLEKLLTNEQIANNKKRSFDNYKKYRPVDFKVFEKNIFPFKALQKGETRSETFEITKTAAETENEYNAKVQHALGFMYENGYGTNQNYPEAYFWYSMASNNSDSSLHKLAKNYMASKINQLELAEIDNKIAVNIKKIQQSKDGSEEFILLQESAKKGDAQAQNKLGEIYKNREGFLKDYHKAFEWFTASAKQGNPDAQDNLARFYFRGLGIKQDLPTAFKLYKQAAVQGNASSQLSLGYMYEIGQGVDQNYPEAYFWYKIAGSNEDYFKSSADDMKEKLTKKQIKKMNKRFSSNFKKYKDK